MTDGAVKAAGDEAARTADRLHSAAIRLLRRLRKADSEAGLTGPQASALSVLVFVGETSLGRLAAAEQVSAPSMSRLIKELEQLGLVERRPDPADGRGVRLGVTDAGRARFDGARAGRLGRLTAALAGRPPRELAILTAAAEMLLQIAEGDDLG
jgi:DNA-binding MarR family transcriptional regulator